MTRSRTPFLQAIHSPRSWPTTCPPRRTLAEAAMQATDDITPRDENEVIIGRQR
jgi:hypothetical protein